MKVEWSLFMSGVVATAATHAIMRPFSKKLHVACFCADDGAELDKCSLFHGQKRGRECVRLCHQQPKCKYSSVWSNGWCNLASECPYKKPDGMNSIIVFRKEECVKLPATTANAFGRKQGKKAALVETCRQPNASLARPFQINKPGCNKLDRVFSLEGTIEVVKCAGAVCNAEILSKKHVASSCYSAPETPCPYSHPYPYAGEAVIRGYCCKTSVEQTASSCPSDLFVKCQAPPCVSPHKQLRVAIISSGMVNRYILNSTSQRVTRSLLAKGHTGR